MSMNYTDVLSLKLYLNMSLSMPLNYSLAMSLTMSSVHVPAYVHNYATIGSSNLAP